MLAVGVALYFSSFFLNSLDWLLLLCLDPWTRVFGGRVILVLAIHTHLLVLAQSIFCC